jgi:hypothetical protein
MMLMMLMMLMMMLMMVYLNVKSSLIYDKPIIVLTSSDLNLLLSRLSRIKLDEIFLKPFNPVLLLQHIDKMLMPVSLSFQIRP